ncbi:MAG: hypothetical protein ACRD9Y_24965 [Blastocatellia bacterium]
MFTQNKNATNKTSTSHKLHSIHVLPQGREFTGKIEAGRGSYQFTFTPKTAASVNGRLVLTGSVKVKTPAGRQSVADGVTATLLATQGSITAPSPMPRDLAPSLKPPQPAISESPITDWTGHLGSVAVMYLKLSPLDGRALGAPVDLSSLQLNARMFPASEIERDLHWLYSALVEAMGGESRDERRASGYLVEINRILKA